MSLGLMALPCGAMAAWQTQQIAPDGAAPITMDGVQASNGDNVVVWNESRSPSEPEVRAAVQTGTGLASAPQDLGDRAFGPVAAADGQGRAYAAWEYEAPTGGYCVRERIYTSTREPGGSFGAPVDAGQGQSPIAIDANARGDVVMLWHQFTPSAADPHTGQEALVAAVRPAGGSFSAPQQVSGAVATDCSKVLVATAIAPSGVAVFLWAGPDGVQAAVRSADGTLTAPQTLSAAGHHGASPELGVDGGGRVLAAWAEGSTPDAGSIHYATLGSSGQFGKPADLGSQMSMTNGGRGLSLAVAANGDAIMAWPSFYPAPGGGGTLGPLKVMLGSAGGSFAPPFDIEPGHAAMWWPSLAIEPDGQALLVFVDAATAETRAAQRAPGGTFGAVRPLVCPAYPADSVALGIHDGTAAAAMRRNDGSTTDPLMLALDSPPDSTAGACNGDPPSGTFSAPTSSTPPPAAEGSAGTTTAPAPNPVIKLSVARRVRLSQALRTGVPFNASSVTGTTADVRLVASSAVRRALRLHRLTLARRVVVLHPGAPIEGALRLRLFAKRALSHVRRPVPLTVELRVGSRIAAAARVTLSRR